MATKKEDKAEDQADEDVRATTAPDPKDLPYTPGDESE